MNHLPKKVIRCPYCQVYPPFTILPTGIMITRQHYGITATPTPEHREVCRRPWELALLEHIQTRHLAAYRELMTELRADLSPAES